MLPRVAETDGSDVTPQPTWLRWAFVGMSALLTAVLATSVVANFLGARQLADTVVSGQAAMLFHTVHRLAPPGPPPPRHAELEAVMDEAGELGLRYIALVRPDGRVVEEVGEPLATFGPPGRAPHNGALMRRAGRIRASSPGGPAAVALPGKAGFGGPPPPRFGGPLGPPPAKAGLPPPGKGPPPPRRTPRIVIEFEPTLVADMEHRARRDLAIGLAAIAVLWGAAALFWRLAGRAARAEAKLVTQRHLASLGEMSAVVAHELRNPLASLKGHAQLLQEQTDDPKLAKKAQRLVDEAVRLQALSTGLLEFVRSGRVEQAPVSVVDVAKQAAAGSLAEVELELDDAPARWTLDADRIRQVLANLLDNAHHAAPDHPATLRARERGGQLELTVRDRGPGVPRDRREEIFAPFHTSRTHGTGLGLAVARRIVELHGGTLTCDDHPDGGAVFTVRLPPGS
jgi:two-component system sensor histidine kinase HydH